MPISGAYRAFVDGIVGRRNAARGKRIAAERACLQALPELRLPTVKTLWPRFAETADREGWPAARSRAEHGPENLAILRCLILNLLRTARPKLPVSRKRKRAGWSDAFARSIIGQMR